MELTPRDCALAALELYRLRLAGVLNWLDNAAAGRAGGGGGAFGGGAGAGGPVLSGDGDAMQAALDSCVEYLLVGESSFQVERDRLLAHSQRYAKLQELRRSVDEATTQLGATVASVLEVQAKLDAKASQAARLLKRIGELRAVKAEEAPERIVAAAERYAYTVSGENWARRPPPFPDDAMIRSSLLFREQAVALSSSSAAIGVPQGGPSKGPAATNNGPTSAPWMDLGPWLPKEKRQRQEAEAMEVGPGAAAAATAVQPAQPPTPLPTLSSVSIGATVAPAAASSSALLDATHGPTVRLVSTDSPINADSTPPTPAPAAAVASIAAASSSSSVVAKSSSASASASGPGRPASSAAGAGASGASAAAGSVIGLLAKLTPDQRKALLARLPPGWRPGQPLPPGTPDLATLIRQITQ